MFTLVSGFAGAQGLPAGQWRYHSYFGQDTLMALSPTTVYSSGGNSIMTYERATGELGTLNKVNGLTEVTVSAMAHAYSRDILVVGYRTGRIDIVEGEKVASIDGLERADISATKQVLGIDIINDAKGKPFAYVMGAFGLVIIDLDKKEVKLSNTNLDGSGSNLPVTAYSICQVGDSLFMATSQGIKKIGVGQNLQDSRLYLKMAGLPNSTFRIMAVANHGGRLYAAYQSNGLYLYNSDSGSWKQIHPGLAGIRSLEEVNGKLTMASGPQLFGIEGEQVTLLAPQDEILSQPYIAMRDDEANIYASDNVRGMVIYQPATQQFQAFQTASPGFPGIFRLYGYNDKMVALPGGYLANMRHVGNMKDGLGVFQNNYWKHLEPNGHDLPNKINDLCDAAYNRQERNLYVTSYGGGIVVLPDDTTSGRFGRKWTVISDTTVGHDGNTLVNVAPDQNNPRFCRMQAITFDPNWNLWACNWSSTVLQLRDAEHKWFSYAPPYANEAAVGQIITDDLYNKYLRITATNARNECSIIVRSVDNKSWAAINKVTGTGGLVSPNVYDMAIDKDGSLWMATGAGVAVLYSPSTIFNGEPYNVTLPIFDGRPLLENDACKAIVLDGGGRKWIGTAASGLWLFDKDVTTVLAHYTTENSPLPSNNINDLAIVPATGELFISTDDAGLVSFGTAATDASLEEAKNSCVRIYPNPVRPGYEGQIAIECLPENAIVKITDVAGRLVFEGKAAGGGIVWNGRDYTGRRPQPGMYLVYAFSDSTNAKVVGRFAMVE